MLFLLLLLSRRESDGVRECREGRYRTLTLIRPPLMAERLRLPPFLTSITALPLGFEGAPQCSSLEALLVGNGRVDLRGFRSRIGGASALHVHARIAGDAEEDGH